MNKIRQRGKRMGRRRGAYSSNQTVKLLHGLQLLIKRHLHVKKDRSMNVGTDIRTAIGKGGVGRQRSPEKIQENRVDCSTKDSRKGYEGIRKEDNPAKQELEKLERVAYGRTWRRGGKRQELEVP